MGTQIITTAGTWANNQSSNLLMGDWAFLSTTVASPIPVAGTFSNWRVGYKAAPGSGKSRTVTLQKDSGGGFSSTALAITVADAATSGSDSDSVTIAANDVVRILPSAAGGPASSSLSSSIEWTPDDGVSHLYGFAKLGADSSNVLYGGAAGATVAQGSSLNGISGTITTLALKLNIAPGGGNTRRYTIYKNGTAQDGSGGTPDTRVTISDGSLTGSATFSLSVSPGDTLYLIDAIVAGSPAGADLAGTIVFQPTTPRQFQFSGRVTLIGNDNGSKYYHPIGSDGGSVSAEAEREVVGPTTTITLTGLRATLETAVSGASRVFTVRKNGADTGLTLTFTGSTTELSTTGSVTISSADVWSIERTNSGTPVTGYAKWTVTGEIVSTSERNVLIGDGNTVTDGSDNFVSGIENEVNGADNSQCHGEGGEVTGSRSVLFNLDGGSYTLSDDDTFEVRGTLKVNGSTVGGGIGDLDDLSDVTISSPATNDVLKYNGSAWVNGAVSGSGSVVVQVVNTQTGAVATGTTLIPHDDTIPQNTEGDQYMTLAITPSSATNTLKIDVVVHLSNSAANQWHTAAIFQDSTANALAAGISRFEPTATAMSIVAFSHYMTSGTTSSTTFKVRAGCQLAGTTTFNGQAGARLLGGVLASSITITEYIP
jgi:hypothetical protein